MCQEHFNSQPHEEADPQELAELTVAFYISTHSLTKRLTRWTENGEFLKMYFNSQPHEEADYSRYSVVNVRTNISTHSLTKRLTENSDIYTMCIVISTHSLTKRLTKGSAFPGGTSNHFNSQPHEEADSL